MRDAEGEGQFSVRITWTLKEAVELDPKFPTQRCCRGTMGYPYEGAGNMRRGRGHAPPLISHSRATGRAPATHGGYGGRHRNV